MDGLEEVRKEKMDNDDIYTAPKPDPDNIAKQNGKPLSFLYRIEGISNMSSDGSPSKRISTDFGNISPI